MTPSRPYLIRAIHQWIVDNGYSPHLLVDAEDEGVDAPREYAHNGKLVLNISPQAVEGLSIANDTIAFSARFRGAAREVSFPTHAVLAIYAKENGRGMVFTDLEDEPPPEKPGAESRRRPTLKVVK